MVYEFKYGRKAMIGPLPDRIYRIEEIKYFDRSEGERQARVWDELESDSQGSCKNAFGICCRLILIYPGTPHTGRVQ